MMSAEQHVPFLQPRQLFADRYRLTEQLGVGGMGLVWRAEDISLGGEEVAVKVLFPHLLAEESSYMRFCSEVLIARKLSHPNIVQVFGHGTTQDGWHYFTMEMVSGRSLKELIDCPEYASLSLSAKLGILYLVARGVSYAHQRGVVHRDLKPQNILISPDGEAKVADFGIARLVHEAEREQRATVAPAGTPQYLAPEEIRGETGDERTDIYSFGITAYELLVGRPPFQGKSLFELAQQHLEQPLPFTSDSELPGWLTHLLHKATAKSREERLASLDEFCEELRRQGIVTGEEHEPEYPSTIISRAEPCAPSDGRKVVGAAFARRVMVGATIIAIVQGLSTGELLWLIAAPFAYLTTFSFSWNRRKRMYLMAVLLAVLTVVGLRLTPGLYKRVVATILRVEYRYGVDLSALRKLYGTNLRPGNLEDFFNAVKTGIRRHDFYIMTHSGIDLNTRDKDGKTILFHATTQALENNIRRLLEAGADPLIRDNAHRLPLSYAIGNRYYPTASVLIAGMPTLCVDDPPWSPLTEAIEMGDTTLASMVIKRVLTDPNCSKIHEKLGFDPLKTALQKDRVEIVKLLREAGAAQ